jgi:hypothetical protein
MVSRLWSLWSSKTTISPWGCAGRRQKAIRPAFRKLARQYHPDVNPGDKAAEEQFKAINEANQVLSDPEQRKKYDALRAQYQRWQQGGRRPQDFNWQDWASPPGEACMSTMAQSLTWKTYSAARARTRTLLRRSLGGRGGPSGPRARGAGGIERSRSRSRWRRRPAARRDRSSWVIAASRPRSRLVYTLERGCAWLVRVRQDARGGRPDRIQHSRNPMRHSSATTTCSLVPVDIYTAALGGECVCPLWTGL